jgi:transcriptional regulator with XRE-family HTH domain
MINAEQIRAARALLDWSTKDLAKLVGLTVNGINKIERGYVNAHRDTLERLQEIFENAGIEFLPGSGLRKKDQIIQIFEGPASTLQLLDDVYATVRDCGGFVRVAGTDEGLFTQDVQKDVLEAHIARLANCGVSERLLIKEGDTNLVGPVETYRWMPEKYFSPYPFYIYGSKVALVSWEMPQKAVVVNDERFADSARKLFDFVWDRTELPNVDKPKKTKAKKQ